MYILLINGFNVKNGMYIEYGYNTVAFVKKDEIVFYNNSISALLAHNEKMIAKMESVLEIFKENRDEVALLWRPHPLIESTLTSMRPQLWEAYRTIRDRYLAEDWGCL